MEPRQPLRPQLLVPDRRPRPRQIEDVPDEDELDPDDLDADDKKKHDKAFDEWWDDDTGTTKVPLPPLNQPEMGIHAPSPEMDPEDKRRQETYRRRRQREQDGDNS